MFDQLTWATGMFTLTASLSVILIYSFRNNEIIQAFIFHPTDRTRLPAFARVIMPGLVIASLYLFELGILWAAYGRDDTTAIDWAVLLPVRALIYFVTESDNTTLASYADQNWFVAVMNFCLEEAWIWWQPGVVQLAMALLLGGLAYLFYRRLDQREYPLWIGIPIAVGVQAAFVYAAWVQWGAQSTQIYLKTEAIPACAALALAISIFVFALGASRSEYERARLQQARVDSAENQLRFLNAQINPHFLNNALNAISGTMHHSPDRARDLLGELGAYFRGVCTSTDTQTSFKTELELVKNYVNLEQARYGERLAVAYQVEDACLPVMIPRLTLQPIVENAIKHGIAAVAEGGRILIQANMQQDRLVIDVQDTGAGSLKPLTENNFGVGLSNVHARLKSIYGDNMTITFDGVWGGGTQVRLSLGERLSPGEQATNG